MNNNNFIIKVSEINNYDMGEDRNEELNKAFREAKEIIDLFVEDLDENDFDFHNNNFLMNINLKEYANFLTQLSSKIGIDEKTFPLSIHMEKNFTYRFFELGFKVASNEDEHIFISIETSQLAREEIDFFGPKHVLKAANNVKNNKGLNEIVDISNSRGIVKASLYLAFIDTVVFFLYS